LSNYLIDQVIYDPPNV